MDKTGLTTVSKFRMLLLLQKSTVGAHLDPAQAQVQTLKVRATTFEQTLEMPPINTGNAPNSVFFVPQKKIK